LPIILSPAAEAPGGGRLVFSSIHEGRRDLYLVNADGSDLTRLTDMPEDEMAPAWSPDGQWIVFHALSHDGQHSNIFKLRPDGSRLTRLTDGPTLDTRAAWSWDGQWIAFLSALNGDMPGALFKMRADGQDRASLDPYDPTTVDQFLLASSNGQHLLGGWLLSTPDGGYNDLARRMDENFQFSQVVWSPDGRRLAYTSRRDGNDEIYSINADGQERARLTNDPAQDWMASWSPDGKRIAFVRSLQGQTGGIYVMNSDGSGLVRLIDVTTAQFPIWSPDGQYLAFVTDYGNTDILRIDDSEVIHILVAASDLAWAPR
jgi:Tol biopolymer transport system component